MDTLGAIVSPLTALWLLAAFPGNYRVVFAFTLLPGVVAAALGLRPRFLATIQYVPGEDPLGSVVAQSPSGGSSAQTPSSSIV